MYNISTAHLINFNYYWFFFSGVSLQRKWKGLRDTYVKEMKKLKTAPSGSGAQKKINFMYFNRLMFLERTVRNKNTESNIAPLEEGAESDNTSSGDREDVMRAPISHAKKQKRNKCR